MNWKRTIRQLHRWLSVLFTIGVLANIASIFGLGNQEPPVWVGLLALLPLILLLLSGLYLFALPYFAGHDGVRQGKAAK
ncbi:MAG: hypothetical protein KL863_28210 [Rhizobium sp.]|nr:hypothetical protein [Rhizobium sp.]